MEDALVKIVDFLNRFDKSCRYKLANVNAKLSSLERKLDYVQHCLNQANPADRGGVLTPIANTPFDLKWQVEQISKRKQNRDQRMRTQLPVLAEQNTELKGLLTLDRARHNEEQKKREVAEHQQQEAERQVRERAEQQRKAEEAKKVAARPVAVAPPENRPVPEVPPQREQKKSVAKQPPAPFSAPVSRPSVDGQSPQPPSNRPPPVSQPVEMPKPPAVNRSGPPQPPGGPPKPQPPGGNPPQPPGGPPQPPGGPPQPPGGNPPAPPPSGPQAPGHQMQLPPHWATGTNVQLEWINKGDESQSPAMDGETCIIKYVGYLANGECFDEAPDNFEFVVGENIEGLEFAVKQMAPGATAKVWIPSPLGYGDEWAGDMIPPNSDLTFDLQVIQILR